MASLADSRLVRVIKRVLDVIAAFAIAALVAVPIVALLAGLEVFDSEGGRPVETWVRTHVAEAPAAADSAGSVLRTQGKSTLQVSGNRAFIMSLAVTEVLGLIGIAGLLRFRSLFASLANGDPFNANNARYLAATGYALVLWHVLAPPLRYLAGRVALSDAHPLPQGVTLYPALQVSVGGLIAGFAVIVMARVLQDAIQLKQDHALTV